MAKYSKLGEELSLYGLELKKLFGKGYRSCDFNNLLHGWRKTSHKEEMTIDDVINQLYLLDVGTRVTLLNKNMQIQSEKSIDELQDYLVSTLGPMVGSRRRYLDIAGTTYSRRDEAKQLITCTGGPVYIILQEKPLKAKPDFFLGIEYPIVERI